MAPIPAKKYVPQISGQTFQKSFKWKKIHLEFLNQEKKGKKKKEKKRKKKKEKWKRKTKKKKR